jgi:putative peptidoglycan lipid II flippase
MESFRTNRVGEVTSRGSRGVAPDLARGAAAGTIATGLSRLTGFVRVLVVAGAMGTTFLANTYQTANTAPNVIFELLAAGVLTSVFVPTFVEYLVRNEREEGWEAADALASVALVVLIGLALLLALSAPFVMRVLTLGVENDALREAEVALGARFLRLFAPQLVFYGAGMIMTGALHAHRRFVLPAIAPIFNNLVVIGVYLAYAFMRGNESPSVSGITDAEVLVLGVGTTAGVVAMTVVLIPQLARLGWRFRFRFQPKHPAVRRGARLGVWALSYAGGYQAGLIVVLMLANRIEGGVAAYQWAFTFFYLPHALFAVPIFNVLFTAMSEHAARAESEALVDRLHDGLAMLGFILLPVAALLIATAGPLARVTLEYGVMTQSGADLVARVIVGFAIGLPTYSIFLVFTRAFYAVGDTKTPALVNAGTVLLASVAGTMLFFTATERWAVAALALGHSIAFAVGSYALARAFGRSVGRVGDRELRRSIVRSLSGASAALAVMVAAHIVLPESSRTEAVVNGAVTTLLGALTYIGLARLFRSPELKRIAGVVSRAR